MSTTTTKVGTWMLIVWVLSCIAAPAGERFTENGDGTITDHALGLMWAAMDNQGDIAWKDAQQWVTYTFPFTIGTLYENWRLPTLAELTSLYGVDQAHPGYESDCGQWVNIVALIRLSCNRVWSADTSAIQAAIFNFSKGYHFWDRMVHRRSYRVLPVRNVK